MESAVTWSRMRTILAVAEAGSVRAGAHQLHVTEPAVSTAISQVERQLHTKLFMKAGRGIVLTEAGRIYADYCRTILGLVAESELAVRRAGISHLRLGAVGTASEYVVPRFLASFHARHPDVEMALTVQPRDELFTSLAHHELDLVFSGRPPRKSQLVSRATRENSLIVVAAPGAAREPLAATWLLRGPGSGTREATLSLFEQLEVAPPTLTLGTLGAVVAAAREGLGHTLVHSDAVMDDIEAGRLTQVHLARTPMNRPWHLTTGEAPTPAAVLFISVCTDAETFGPAAFHLPNRPRG